MQEQKTRAFLVFFFCRMLKETQRRGGGRGLLCKVAKETDYKENEGFRADIVRGDRSAGYCNLSVSSGTAVRCNC